MASAERTSGERWDWRALGAVALRETKRVLRNRADAEDAAQEAVVRAYRARSTCQTPEAPEAWIASIARREAHRIAARPLPVPTSPDEMPEEASAQCDSAESVVDRVAAASLLSQFPRAERALLLRRYVLEQTSAEIAAAHAMAPATVRVRLHRAIQRLHEHKTGFEA
jgi:RNA polymerase sigma-70 factor, ECF subfamily